MIWRSNSLWLAREEKVEDLKAELWVTKAAPIA